VTRECSLRMPALLAGQAGTFKAGAGKVQKERLTITCSLYWKEFCHDGELVSNGRIPRLPWPPGQYLGCSLGKCIPHRFTQYIKYAHSFLYCGQSDHELSAV
jgi:hypothetical protein